MSWYKVTLTGDMAKRHCWGFAEEVFDYHMKIMDDDNVPYPTNDAVVFKLTDPPAGTCTFFFSPDAGRSYEKLIEYYGGEKCFKPSASDVSLCVGSQEAMKLLSD